MQLGSRDTCGACSLVYPKTVAAKSAKCPRVSARLTVGSERCYCERMLNAPAWEIGRALGIPIRVHPSWFLVFLFVTWSLATGYLPDALPGLSNFRYWGMGAVAAVLLFLSVLLHELGHSYVAQRYRIPIGQITLFLFGGVAQMRAEPPSPKAEFLDCDCRTCGQLRTRGVLVGPRRRFRVVACAVRTGICRTWRTPGIGECPAGPLQPDSGFSSRRRPGAPCWALGLGTRFSAGDEPRGVRRLRIRRVARGMWRCVVGRRHRRPVRSVDCEQRRLAHVHRRLSLRRRRGAPESKLTLRIALSGTSVRDVMMRAIVTMPSQLSLQSAVDEFFVAYGYGRFPGGGGRTGRSASLPSRTCKLFPRAYGPGARWGM